MAKLSFAANANVTVQDREISVLSGPMKEIAYISRPRGLVFDDDVLAILRVSQENNARHGVTGILIYDGDSFLQLLEGETDVVDRLYRNIVADPRHNDIETVADGPISRRRFANWTMRYKRVESIMDMLGDVDAPRRDGRFGRTLVKLSEGL